MNKEEIQKIVDDLFALLEEKVSDYVFLRMACQALNVLADDLVGILVDRAKAVN